MLVERAGVNAGKIKQIASAIMNQKLGAKAGGGEAVVNVDALIAGMSNLGVEETDDDE